ncbi:hypothetical protein ANCDUO_07416 [Ancylostoma duodenale]|uniref:Uncharacterized protein n=1 Tax=Ancylostoma duodenale TaxID=51022 RepID=A0A0C2GYV2_9BILA|nr:hypothetical protein ANCDUO_07416 [Ancylostoma duodenale]
MFGYGFTFGEKFINPFIGIGDYFFDPEREDGSSPDKRVWQSESIYNPIVSSPSSSLSFTQWPDTGFGTAPGCSGRWVSSIQRAAVL